MSLLRRARCLDEPHHDGSELYVDGDELRVHVPLDVDAVVLRYVEDGEARGVEASTDGDGWWSARLPLTNPVMNYRWLLSGGEVGYAWLNGLGLVTHDVPDADDFVFSTDAGPDWHLRSVVYEIFPDRFATTGAGGDPPEWAVPRDWHPAAERPGARDAVRVVRRRPARRRGAPRSHRAARCERHLPHTRLPLGQHAPLRR
jgi:alpha-glucosidase